MRTILLGVLAGVSIAGLVRAAEPLPVQLETCTRMSRDSERLACYDQAIALIKSGSTREPAPSPENMFGANGDIAPAAASPTDVKREELKQISGAVTSLHRTDDGMIVVALDNGQLWRQQDKDAVLVISPGDAVIVTRAALGTFRITDKRGRSARFKRVR
jgi:hypothetical protein